MTDGGRAQTMRMVEARLRGRYPQVDPTVVEAAVLVSHTDLSREWHRVLPSALEREARRRLAFATSPPPVPVDRP